MNESLSIAVLSYSTKPHPRRVEDGCALAARHTWSTAAEAHLRLYREVC